MGGSFGGGGHILTAGGAEAPEGGHTFTLKSATNTDWVNFEFTWTASETGTFYLWWKMHGFKKGNV